MPVGHPAAGLHQDREQVQIQEGFRRLGQLIRGEIPPHPPINQYPNPQYRRIYDRDLYCSTCFQEIPFLPCCGTVEIYGAELTAAILAGRTVISIDTEGDPYDPWCLTFCVRPGEAWLIRSTETESLAALNRHINAPGGMCTVIMHYLAHDIPVCEPHPKIIGLRGLGVIVNKHQAVNPDGSLTLRDTMSEAFLLGGIEPKGLKPLGWRLLGVDMKSYEELVGPTEQQVSRRYIEHVYGSLKCGRCDGTAKGPRRKTHKADCTECSGSGRVAGKKAGSTKQCGCVKTVDKCETCVDGMLIPMPDRELVFDASKAEFRYKQPQSLGKWFKRRLGNDRPVEDAAVDLAEDRADVGGGTADVPAPDLDDSASDSFFKLRHDWLDLAGRSDFEYVEALCGRIPRTTLTEVEKVEGAQAVTDYASADADICFRIAPILESRLRDLRLLTVREQDAAFIPMISRMEQIGMRIDRPHFETFQLYLSEKLDQIRSSLGSLLELDSGRMNPTRDKVADLLFRQLGLPAIKLTKSGTRESVDDDVLGALKAQLAKKTDDPTARFAVQVIDLVTDYREHEKLNSSYVLKILRHADRYDRIHTKLDYTIAATGRLTSSDPINLQTLPNPDNYPAALENDWLLNYGLRTRGGFIAKDGYKLGSADYSQIEMVVGAHLTQDPGMLEVFRQGLDLHYYAAAMMFGIAYDQVPKALRTQVKPLNFGAFYGLSAIGLQAQFASFPSGAIEKSEAECQELIDRYYRAFPGVMAWKQRLWDDAERDGYVRDLFGRIRWVPGLRSSIRKVRSAAEREAANMPIQSTANGIIRIGSRRIWENVLPQVWSMGVDAEVIMQTHDENVVEAPDEHIGWVMGLVGETMRNAVQLSVPIKVGMKIGDNLAEVK